MNVENEMALRRLVTAIGNYEHLCTEMEYTDTGTLWLMTNGLVATCKAILEESE